jgi:arsenate reductase
MKRPVVLFVCTGNSARSQIAEGLLRKHAADIFDAQSAGTEPKGLNPLAVEVMREVDIDIRGHRSKNVSEFKGQEIQYAIFVCSSADDRCPTLAGFTGVRLYWPFEDPAAAIGTEEARLEVFREVRNQIHARIADWIAQLRAAAKLSAPHA